MTQRKNNKYHNILYSAVTGKKKIFSESKHNLTFSSTETPSHHKHYRHAHKNKNSGK
jgi:hypothetical protein